MGNFYGNKNALVQIGSALKNDKLNHAYLICGVEGIGKTTFAKYFAKSILCNDKKQSENGLFACGVCSSCSKFDNGSHPDAVEYGNMESSGKNSFHVKETRELKLETYVKPNESDYRINLLYNIQSMTTSAANSLLKILEEPPEHVIFIMTCDNKNALMPTVISRVIPINLAPLHVQEVYDAIINLMQISDSKLAETAAMQSDGILGKALDFITEQTQEDEKESKKKSINIQELANILIQGNAYNSLAAVSKIENDRQKAIMLIEELRELFAQILRGNEIKLTNKKSFNSHLTISKISVIIEKLGELNEKLQANANVQLILTILVDTIDN